MRAGTAASLNRGWLADRAWTAVADHQARAQREPTRGQEGWQVMPDDHPPRRARGGTHRAGEAGDAWPGTGQRAGAPWEQQPEPGRAWRDPAGRHGRPPGETRAPSGETRAPSGGYPRQGNGNGRGPGNGYGTGAGYGAGDGEAGYGAGNGHDADTGYWAADPDHDPWLRPPAAAEPAGGRGSRRAAGPGAGRSDVPAGPSLAGTRSWPRCARSSCCSPRCGTRWAARSPIRPWGHRRAPVARNGSAAMGAVRS